MSIIAKRDEAIVLEVAGRFYAGKSKTGRIQTAWSIAGAKLFGPWMEDEISHCERILAFKGKQAVRRFVRLGE